MAGLPWVKVATDFAEHPKAHALARRLADPRAALHLPPIWGHFARHYADGSMPDTEDAICALERAALWAGEPGALVAALVAVGLLDRRRKRIAVHGWVEWQEKHAEKMARDRERMRAKRAEARANGSATVSVPSRDGRAEEEMERRGEEDHKERAAAAAREAMRSHSEGMPQALVEGLRDAADAASRNVTAADVGNGSGNGSDGKEGEHGGPASRALADALGQRWSTSIAPARAGQREELEVAIGQLGLRAAMEECIADVTAAVRGGRLVGPPGSLGFFTHRLTGAARARRAEVGDRC